MPKRKTSAAKTGTRRARRRAGGEGYTWFVRVTKTLLPLAALALIGVVIVKMSDDPQISQLSQLPSQEKTAPGQIELVKPKYEGIDAKGRKYTLTAEGASRDMNAAEAVMLDKPHADIVLEGGKKLAVQAARGRFDNKAAQLFLAGNVVVHHDSGYEIRMQDVAVDLAKRAAASKNPVEANGPVGALRAQNVAVTAQGDLIVFGGPAQVTLRKTAKAPGKGPL